MVSFRRQVSNVFAHRTLVLHPDYRGLEAFMQSLPERFAAGEGEVIYKGRNELRRMRCGEHDLVVKSFHRPNLVNRFVYGVFRPSKAKRYKEVRENPYFNAMQVKFAYAVTCHKAQGGQWKCVFVDRMLFGDEPMSRDLLRWLYTAITRATEKL